MTNFLGFISRGLHQIQRTFFPDLEHEAGPIPETLIKLTYVLETVHSHKIPLPEQCWTGRPPKSRHAFVAKAFLKISTTVHLVERLQSDRHLRLICEFETYREVPSESVFSRTFTMFAETQLPYCVHEALVKTYLGDEIAGHISRDSTAIEAREKAKKKETQTELATSSIKRKGRPRKGEPKKVKEVPRLQKQEYTQMNSKVGNLTRRSAAPVKRGIAETVETF